MGQLSLYCGLAPELFLGSLGTCGRRGGKRSTARGRGCRALGAGDSGRPGSGTADSEADFWPTRTLGRGRADAAKRGDLCWFSGGGASTSGGPGRDPGCGRAAPRRPRARLAWTPAPAWHPKPRREPRLCQWASCRGRDPLCGPTRAGCPHRSARRRSPVSVPGVRPRRRSAVSACADAAGAAAAPARGLGARRSRTPFPVGEPCPGTRHSSRLTRTRPPPQHFGPGRSPGRGGEGSRSRPCLQRRRPSHQLDLGRPAEAHGRVPRDCATAAKLTTLRRGSPPGSSLGR